jgi:arylsulfatase A-like enzyme
MVPRPSWLGSAAAGLALGLAAFAAEGVLVLRETAIGIQFDVQGPLQAVLAAVRPQFPGLVARIVLAYAVAGIALGLYAGLLVRLVAPRRALGAALGWIAAALLTVTALAWDRAIARPALLDDLPWFRPALAWLVDAGQPWHPRAFAVACLVALAFAAFIRRRATREPLSARLRLFGAAAVAAGCAALPWATLLPTPSNSKPRARAWKARDDATRRVRGSGQREQPLVVLIGVDAFRPDRLRALGGRGDVAPHIDAFVRDATLFTSAWTPIAQTEPAWRSLLTARWPHRNGVRYPLTAESKWLPLPTFPQILAASGWRTAFATDCSRFHYEPATVGFTERHQPPRGALNFMLEKMRFRALGLVADNALGARLLPELLDNRAIAGIHDPAGYARRLARTVGEVSGDRPTFFTFHATAAHFPGDAVFPFYRKFVRSDAPLDRRLRMFFSPIGAGGGVGERGWGSADSAALYDELLAQADAQVGVILDELQRRGLYDEAAIIVFSDHGESFHDDRPELAGATPVHGARLSEEENRILIAIKPPRAQGPATVDALVRLVDIGPTILELARVPPLEGVDGVSLVPLLEGRPMPPLKLYAETGFTHASPAAFDPHHATYAPRTFDAFQIREDGVVEVTEATHEAALLEKDVGAFDGRRWIVRSPRSDGTVRQTPAGDSAAQALSSWLDSTIGEQVVQRSGR